MTLRDRKRAARVLTKIVKAEFPNTRWSRPNLLGGLRSIATQAQQQGLVPEDLLTRDGRDAFTTIARAIISQTGKRLAALTAEWALVVALATPASPIELAAAS